MNNKENIKKALFFQRLVAFIIDMFIIYLVVSIVSLPFVDTKKSDDLNNKAILVMEQYQKGEINSESYIIQYRDLSYKMAKNNGMVTVITLLLYVTYFVVYQLYKNGQTIGKKIMKIRVVSAVGDLNANQMIFRSFIANSLLVEMLGFILLLFSPKDIYFYGTLIFEIIQYLIIFVSIIMITSRKDGCSIHDLLVHTKVVQV